jgi:DNA-binding transcriptional regulator YhcF (GntR family)
MKFKESKSIYLQIADRINDEILQGQYAEEGRIPSVREYAATVEVNANTVVRTYDYLQGQEIIYNKRGIGYFVSAGAKRPDYHFA